MAIIISLCFWVYFGVTLILIFPLFFILRVLTFWDSKDRFAHTLTTYWSYLYSAVNPYWKIHSQFLHQPDHQKTYIIVANHQSFLDILVLFRTHLHFKWVAKDTLFYLPIFGWILSLCRYIKIKRGDEKSKKELYTSVSRWLKLGVSILIFPEGTRSDTGEIKNFKAGAFKMAVENGISILPVIIDGTKDALPARSIFFSHQAYISMTVLDEIPITDDLGSSQEEKVINLTKIVHQKMKAALQKVRTES